MYRLSVGRVLIVAVVLLLSHFAVARSSSASQDDPVTVDNLDAYGNVWYGLRVSGTNTDGTPISGIDQKLSGTKVELSVTVGSGFSDLTPPSGSPTVSRVTVSTVNVYILGSEVDDVLPANAPAHGIVCGTAGGYRLATTCFSQNSPINVRVTCTFTFYHDGASTQVPIDKTLSFKAYNLLQTAGTTTEGDGTPSNLFLTISSTLVDHAQSSIQGINHALNPINVADALNESAADLLGKAINATVLLGYLHGAPTELWDSDTSESFTTTEMATSLLGKGNSIPKLNLVALWACEAFSAEWENAFSITAPDRAFCGFEEVIYTHCWTGLEWEEALAGGYSDPYEAGILLSSKIYDHAEQFVDHIVAGSTVEIARNVADFEIPMINQLLAQGQRSYWKVPMQIAGDPDTRLKYVYLTPSERAEIISNLGDPDVYLLKVA